MIFHNYLLSHYFILQRVFLRSFVKGGRNKNSFIFQHLNSLESIFYSMIIRSNDQNFTNESSKKEKKKKWIPQRSKLLSCSTIIPLLKDQNVLPTFSRVYADSRDDGTIRLLPLSICKVKVQRTHEPAMIFEPTTRPRS